MKTKKCPGCGSPDPKKHPATGAGGEVYRICGDKFHESKRAKGGGA